MGKEGSLGEQLWKNETFLEAADRYPEFSNDELERLVERDWKYMREDERQRIIRQQSGISREVCEKEIEKLECELMEKFV
jgi:hypothetical protein